MSPLIHDLTQLLMWVQHNVNMKCYSAFIGRNNAILAREEDIWTEGREEGVWTIFGQHNVNAMQSRSKFCLVPSK